ncbi:hypothetical protein JCGZ_26590 [Jatropha curcas]|uniref:Uncharacterized protein n=1 Tax=Jatropha curcas TaxID=180498 RepID=A0A067L4K2_JATCU|nr:hypothetical protein JCGZ_26590 [Jatropha curcas]
MEKGRESKVKEVDEGDEDDEGDEEDKDEKMGKLNGSLGVLNARRPHSSFFFFLSSPPPLLSSTRSATPTLPDTAPARLTPPAPLHCNSGHSIAVWTQLEKHFIGDEAITAMLKVASEKLCTDRYANFTYRMRRSGKKQQRSETSGDGAGPSRHTGGSISAIETARLLAKELGCEPTPIEVFTYTHTKDHDLNTFVARRVVSVNENYTIAREHLVSSQTDESEAESRIDEVALYTASGLKHHSFTAAQHLTLLHPAHDHNPSTLPRSLLNYGLQLLPAPDPDAAQRFDIGSCR